MQLHEFNSAPASHPDERAVLNSDQYQALFDQGPDACYVLGIDGSILKANQAACRQTGFEQAQLENRSLFELTDEPDRETVLEQCRSLLNTPDETLVLECHHRRKDGFAYPVDLRIGLVSTQPKPVFLVVAREAEDRVNFQQELKHRLEFEQLMVKISSRLIQSSMPKLDDEIVNSLGLLGEFFDVDRAYLILFSSDRATMSNTHEWTGPDIDAHIDRLQNIPLDTFPRLMAELEQDRTFHIPRVGDLPPDSTERIEFERESIQSILIVPVMRRLQLAGFVGFDAVRQQRTWHQDHILGLRFIAQALVGVVESRKLSASLSHLAFHDSLTGLANRKYLSEQLQRILSRNRRGDEKLELLMLDLDDFKPVNDRHGHSAGDRLLCEVASRLLEVVPRSALVARFGGDEFTILLRNAETGQAERLARDILETCARPFQVESRQMNIQASIGIATCHGNQWPVEEFINRADRAMYIAKAAGKGCYRFYRE